MDKRVFWIWLQNAFGPGSSKPKQIVDRVHDPKEFYRGGIGLWSSFSFISDKELTALNTYGPEQAAAALDYCLRLGQKVITPDSSLYPTLLKEIYNPPAVLYVCGEIPDFSDSLWIGAVGTRKAGEVGMNATWDICNQLARHDVVIVSGGALGVDSQAHRAAISAGGKTVALLPCALDYPYLMDNAFLRREILDMGGALMSEFPINTPVQRGSFQIRNRLISGISNGVFVAEAPKRSGALITAKYALEQDRDVFAFVGSDEAAFAGCAGLVADGAMRVRTAGDILKNYEYLKESENKPQIPVKPVTVTAVRKQTMKPVSTFADSQESSSADTSGVSEAAKSILDILGAEPLHASEIELKTALPTGDILAALTELELFGLITVLPGQRFTKN